MRYGTFLSAALAAIVSLAGTGSLHAEEWQALGGRAKAMGGAGVAVEPTPYWNPASLLKLPRDEEGKKKPLKITDVINEFELGFQFGLEITEQGDVVAEGDDVVDLVLDKDFEAIQARLDNGTASADDIESALVLIKEINDLNRRGEGVYAWSGASAHVRLGKSIAITGGVQIWSGADPNFDLGIFSALSSGGFGTLLASSGTTGLTPSTTGGQALSTELQAEGIAAATADELSYLAESSGIDLSNADVRTGIVLAAANTDGGTSSGETLYNNKSGFTLSGVLIQELGVNVSLPLLDDMLSVGATVKILQGTTYKRDYVIADIEDGQDLVNETYTDFRENRQVSSRLGIDIGVLARPLPFLTVGLVGKNLTRPVFAMAGDGSFTVYPQVRLGVAVSPIDQLTLALDFDLIRNDSDTLDGYHSQIMAVGAELRPLNGPLFGLAFRLGAYRNLSMEQEEIAYSAGFGLRIWAFEIEVAGNSSAYSKTMAAVEKSTVGDPSDPNPEREVSEWLPERMGLAVSFRFIIKF